MALSFYEKLLNRKREKKTEESNDTVKNLYKVPLKDKGLNETHFEYCAPDLINQADLLFLPSDRGYQYALVVADVGTRRVDAEPLKKKDNASVTKAFKTIYNRGILKKPKVLVVDSGTEFQGSTKKSLEDIGILVKRGKVQRHRTIAIVERANQTIGKLIHYTIISVEASTGNASSEWTPYLPHIITAMNNRAKKMVPKQKPLTSIDQIPDPVCQGDSCTLLKEGQQVRVQLEAPEGFLHGDKLHGNFRSSDIRWTKSIFVIDKVLLKPGAPPLYLLKNDPSTAYTKNQLQVVGKNEEVVKPTFIKENIDRYTVEKILDRKVEKNVVYYKIKWRSYPISASTWERKSSLIKDIPALIKRYDDKYL